jgi:hypothetical protein
LGDGRSWRQDRWRSGHERWWNINEELPWKGDAEVTHGAKSIVFGITLWLIVRTA